MICYKDMTFCTYGPICKNSADCPRVLTKQIRRDAAKWWGGEDAPIAVFAEFPKCFKRWFDEEEKGI